jgi:regulatory protein
MAASLFERALRLLARREHSRWELARKLAPHAENAEALEHLLDALESRGYLSDARFAELFVARRRDRLGRARLSEELKGRGIAREIIERVLAGLEDSEFERARAVWQAKFGTAPTDARSRARQWRFLHGRGFSPRIIARILREDCEEGE